jgi:hypothetical protein
MDFSHFSTLLENGILRSQYLYSTAVERRIVEEDFESIIPETAKERVAMESYKKILVSLTQKEQIAFLKWQIESKPNTRSIIERFSYLDEKVKKVISIADSEQEAEDLVIEAITSAINNSLADVGKMIKILPATILKKVLVKFLENGMDIKAVLDAEAQEKEKKAVEQKEKILEELRNLPEPIRGIMAQQFGIDPEEIDESEEDDAN